MSKTQRWRNPTSEQLSLDWPAMIARKDDIVVSWSQSKNATPAKLGVPVLRGRGTFAGPHDVTLDGRNYSAEKIVMVRRGKPGVAKTPNRAVSK